MPMPMLLTVQQRMGRRGMLYLRTALQQLVPVPVMYLSRYLLGSLAPGSGMRDCLWRRDCNAM